MNYNHLISRLVIFSTSFNHNVNGNAVLFECCVIYVLHVYIYLKFSFSTKIHYDKISFFLCAVHSLTCLFVSMIMYNKQWHQYHMSRETKQILASVVFTRNSFGFFVCFLLHIYAIKNEQKAL